MNGALPPAEVTAHFLRGLFNDYRVAGVNSYASVWR